jgi:hypothetical protein
MAFLSLLFGQNPTPENHAKLLFTIGIPSGLRSPNHIKIYHKLVPFSCGTKSQLVSFSLDLKNCIHFSVQFTWILCLIIELTGTGQVNVTCPVGSTLS